MMNFISFCGGTRKLLDIANLIEETFWDLLPTVKKLIVNKLSEQREVVFEKNYYK